MNAGLRSLVLSLSLALALAACGGPQGAHVRFARASPSEIQAAQNSGQVVWYDFEAGDEVPLEFGLIGVADAETEQPTRMIARRPFSIVIFPDGRTYFSFDGGTLTNPQMAARWTVALGADDQRGRAAFLLFIGQQQDLVEAQR